ncbi:heavy-metal-associated domain-containing protein [Nafulsella turpanensis]|uniref:heavy-metal-associated domain-containing protein n=1 Tax=Nafulsella turpanensis TaxID=1265690 RepID=UPI00034BE0FB|nr:heavy metal-associated domain-containing protein [Nafulsella turpanensis]
MKTRKFKTDINCDSCVRNVMPYLNSVPDVESWEVDTNSKEKVLTVKGNFKDEEVEKAVADAGFHVKG